MSKKYNPPPEGTPIALRLVPLITGFSIDLLIELLTKETSYCDKDDFVYLDSYQWHENEDPTEQPIPALRLILQNAAKAKQLYEIISAIPPTLFVRSTYIEGIMIDTYASEPGTNPALHNTPDWHPNIHGFEELIRECPPKLTTICKLTKVKQHQNREDGKKKTADRNAALQAACDEILRTEPNLLKYLVVNKLHEKEEFNDMSKALIARIIRVK